MPNLQPAMIRRLSRLGMPTLVVLTLLTAFVTLSTACRDDVSPRASQQALSEATVDSFNDKPLNDKPLNDKPLYDKQSTEAGEANQKYYYSPFVVKLDGGHFNTVSFKDVGLGRETTEANDPLFEVIAESFAYEISQRDAFDYQAQVVYDEKILDPSNHLYCGMNHLYIDVWRSSSPNRWGFSLWSGCGELDNFAWKEVPGPSPTTDLTVYVEPLTSGIVEALEEAAKSNCFQKTC